MERKYVKMCTSIDEETADKLIKIKRKEKKPVSKILDEIVDLYYRTIIDGKYETNEVELAIKFLNFYNIETKENNQKIYKTILNNTIEMIREIAKYWKLSGVTYSSKDDNLNTPKTHDKK